MLKIFAGEFATHLKENTDAESRKNLKSVLPEAAFMNGFERHADIEQMCSYAPLIAHGDAWQWQQVLI